MKENMLRNRLKHRRFSTISRLQGDKWKYDRAIEKWQEMQDSKKVLKSDLSMIGGAVKAASKISTGEKPSEDEQKVLDELLEQYSSFFESDSEDEKDAKNPSSVLSRIMSIKSYLRSEKRVLNSNIKQLEEKMSTPKSLKRSFSETEEESSIIPTLEKGESSKRPALEKGESSSSNQSPGDYIDNLPYNPFDDIGND